jgi:hypothetical protein
MGLGFGAGVETVRLENGDGGGDSDSLCFYVAITLPQMPLSKIDGVVNLFSVRREKERHLIFSACWRDCSVWCEIKFLGGQTPHLLSRDQNLFRVLIGNDYDKMLLT